MEEPYSNEFGTICFHKTSLKGTVKDYVISFSENNAVIDLIIDKTFDLAKHLFKKYETKNVKARIIAKVNYFHLNDQQEIISKRSYHFTSYKTELVLDPYDFFVRHMTKIASRMDSFHSNGSNLIIDKIEHIHIAVTLT